MIRSPTPPLDFDETAEVMQRVFLGRRVTINLYQRNAAGPVAWLSGWLNEIRVSADGAILRLGHEKAAEGESRAGNAGQVVMSRASFEQGGAAFTGCEPEPLKIEESWFELIIASDRLPDWPRVRRLDADQRS